MVFLDYFKLLKESMGGEGMKPYKIRLRTPPAGVENEINYNFYIGADRQRQKNKITFVRNSLKKIRA